MDTQPPENGRTVDVICGQMNDVRCSLSDDVEEMVDSARTLADWRHYVRTYPWICMAGAAAIGFLVVPKRVEIISPSADALEQLAKRNKLVVKSNPRPQSKGGIGGALFGMLANAAVRGAMGYLGQNAGRFLGESENNGGTNAEPNR